ncbi:unnamed protein product [Caenorhabditis auriculariae]|uniref:Uncharacterized protein n=1 Tax=Caenorhabditis auriculariae TaxID=2777116 RepID=A0A8S1HMQ6_9PELO|nr:unnamed protein product [Caenorhabditis auriculariae]
MADAVRGFWQSIVNTKRAYLNPHEHFGRANICRAALASYVGIYFLFKWNQQRKAKALQAEKTSLHKNAVNDSLARAGPAGLPECRSSLLANWIRKVTPKPIPVAEAETVGSAILTKR